MRSKDTLLRLHRFHVEEKRRQVGDIEMMMADFRRKQDDLDQQIAYEEQKTGVSDPANFNYSMTAKSIRKRRENLLATIDDLQAQLDRANEAVAEEESELRKVELLAEKDASHRNDIKMIGRPADNTASRTKH
ncbi:flagellar export protein FliJ [Anderseniella sp. Alg231-50]|uniref:flagellar export protein FliJ n=1 Tax=Anderseniella sp. Alg231-50 TaxID=1922226 RepID=UPI00307CAEC5